MAIPFDAIKRLPVSEFIGQDVNLKPDGPGEFKGLCPFHQEKTPSFTVSDSKGFYHCYGCGAHGDLIDYLTETRGLDIREAANVALGGALTGAKPIARRVVERVDAYEGITPQSFPDSHIPIQPGSTVTAHNPKQGREWSMVPSMVFPYRGADGSLIGYVLRVEYEGDDGKRRKLTPFVLNARLRDGRETLTVMRPARPLPLYGLDRLAACPTAGVLIVEGEKAADAAQRLLPRVAVVAWCGGTAAVEHIDLDPLRGRRVTLWPDADEPGLKAMATIADRLQNVAGSTFIVTAPDGVASGWDLADAEQEGWDGARALAHVKALREAGKQPVVAREEPPAQSDDAPPVEAYEGEEAPPDQPPEDSKPAPWAPDDMPFRCLGYAGKSFYYLPARAQQIVCLTASEHKRLSLYQLAPEAWWAKIFASKEGADFNAAANSLMGWCYRADVFDPRNLRGRGAWIDGERIVFHAGDRLIVDGAVTKIHDHSTRYIYTRDTAIETEQATAADNATAGKLLALCESLAWKHRLDAKLLAGWAVIAPICGVLHWRPHVWVNGARGSGKTWVLENIVQPCVGPSALQVQSATTEAGIRQRLKCDARPIIFDEAESENKRGQDRMQGILEFARACSSDTEAIIAKGTASGDGMAFKPRACIAFASIGVAATQAADISRISTLELRRRGADFQSAFDATKTLWADSIGQEGFCESIRARSLALASVIRANARTFARAVAAKLGDARLGDQIGTLLAGAYSLASRNALTFEAAEKWVAGQDWSAFEQDEADSDQNRAFTLLVDAHIRIDRADGPALTRTVGEVVAEALDPTTDQSEARAILARHGLRVYDQQIAVANQHQFLARIFADTPWAAKWKDQLARLPGAKPSDGAISFGPGSKHRAVMVPLKEFEA